ncbi:MAG TPA: TorF family putative porin [Gammaproteobacteria bacterium]|jgi:uncharacterized protein (TIGR02001 family)
MRSWNLAWIAMGLMCCSAARADDAPAPPFVTGNVQFMTNYVGRGLGQSLGNPSVEAELDLNSKDGWYGGIDGNSINWVDQVYPGDSVGVEIDFWGGWRQHFGPDWTTKFGLLRLQFPGTYVQQNPPSDEPNTTEAYGYVAWKAYSARLNYSVTDAFATPDSKGSMYLDLSGSQLLYGPLSFSEHLGRNQRRGTNSQTGLPNSRSSYTDYKLALNYALPDGMSLTLAHTWTNANPQVYTLHGYVVSGHHTWLLLEKDF